MRRRRAGFLARVAVAGLLAGGLAAASQAAERRLGVARFAGEASNGGSEAMDGLAEALVRELAVRSPGVQVLATPLDSLPATPRAEAVRRHAQAERLDWLVVGGATPEGEAVALRAELRSGHSGARLAAFQTRAAGPGESGVAAATLAEAIAAELPAPPPAVSAPTPGEGVDADEDGEEGDSGGILGIASSDPDAPIRIRSDELEMLSPADGSREIHFSRNVVVEQADVTLWTDALAAHYASGSSQPDRLEARGHVRVEQGDRRARCDEATYDRRSQRVVCRGRAELVEGCDRVRGREIHFELDRERVRVLGGSSVVIHQDEAEGAPEDCRPGASS